MLYAFCDEFGAFGFDFEKDNVSSHFIVAAIIVEEEQLDFVQQEAERIRQRFFQSGEMKSSNVGNNHKRRRVILEQLKALPFKIYLFVADKRKIYEESGLRYKTSFYKFLNQYVYNALHISFQKLTIVADETGSNEYMRSFAEYVRSKNPVLSLFEEFDFKFDESKHGVIVQIADIVAGSIAYSYDVNKMAKANGANYKTFLGTHIIGIQEFPVSYKTFKLEQHRQYESSDDMDIANICFRRALAFKQKYENKEVDENVRMQIAILDYLLFRFMNNSIRKYISTQELQNSLINQGFGEMTTQSFRNKIIAKLRDSGVIIASSSKGYKIPSKKQEIEDFVRHGQGIIEPMLHRIRLCYDSVFLGSEGRIEILNAPEYYLLKKILNVYASPNE